MNKKIKIIPSMFFAIGYHDYLLNTDNQIDFRDDPQSWGFSFKTKKDQLAWDAGYNAAQAEYNGGTENV